MKIDVSEIKSFRSCKRKWQYSSRNRMHLTTVEPKSVFAMGTLFHEGLHALYLGVPVEDVLEDVQERMTEDHVALIAMLSGYAREVIPMDMERYKILDIEYKFDFVPADENGVVYDPDIEVCGSIDMIALGLHDNKVYGFEHKTCKNFRDDTYMWMDEQPRVYTIALEEYVNRLNHQRYHNWVASGKEGPEPIAYGVGGVFINEVKKLLRKFAYRRTLCRYPKDDLNNFFRNFMETGTQCKKLKEADGYCAPNPGWMTCQMCDFSQLCQQYMYSTVSKEEVLQLFSSEFMERETDHLLEK